MNINWRLILQTGLISGIILLYMGMIGLLGAFIDREVVEDTFTLAQLILVLVPFVSGFLIAKRLKAVGASEMEILDGGFVVGFLSIIPTAIVMFASQWFEIDSILVSLNRDWLVMVSFDNRENILKGILLLTVFNTIASFLGARMRLLPDKVRAALLNGLIAATLISIFGRTLSLILQGDVKAWLLNRETIRLIPALLIYAVCMSLGFVWVYLGDTIRSGVTRLPEWIRTGFMNSVVIISVVMILTKTFSLLIPEPVYGWLNYAILSWSIGFLVFVLVAFALGFGWAWYSKMQNMKSKVESGNSRITTQQFTIWILFGLLLLFLPDIVGRSLSLTLFMVGLYILMGLGLNISIGLAGMLDLGYVTSFAVGAYTMAVMSSTSPDGMGSKLTAWLTSEAMGMSADSLWFIPIITNFWFVLIISMLMAMLVGFLFALPILKMRGDYLAIATLGFGQIIGALVGSDWLAPTLGGAQGIQDVPRPWFFGFELANPENLYYLVLAACALVFYSVSRLANSRTGRQWMAIREDEDVAAAMGIDVPRSKLLAFTLAAAAGGLAGGIFTTQVTTAFPNSFEALVSFNVLALIIVGGLGSNRGIILGALFLVGMPDLLREFSDFRFLIYGILLIVMMLYRPEGLLPSQLAVRELRKDENTVPAGEA